MEKENKQLKEKMENWEDHAQMQKYKLQKMAKDYATTKDDIKSLHEENKKLWTHIKNSKIEVFWCTPKRKKKSSNELDYWMQQAKVAQKKVAYWKSMHSSTFGKLAKCLKGKKNDGRLRI